VCDSELIEEHSQRIMPISSFRDNYSHQLLHVTIYANLIAHRPIPHASPGASAKNQRPRCLLSWTILVESGRVVGPRSLNP
jgi:hypothetical protein